MQPLSTLKWDATLVPTGYLHVKSGSRKEDELDVSLEPHANRHRHLRTPMTIRMSPNRMRYAHQLLKKSAMDEGAGTGSEHPYRMRVPLS